jgi:hypothetical protein
MIEHTPTSDTESIRGNWCNVPTLVLLAWRPVLSAVQVCILCVCVCPCVRFLCGVFLWFFKRTLRKYDYRYPVSPHNQPNVPLFRYDEFGASKDSNIVTAKRPTHTHTHTHIHTHTHTGSGEPQSKGPLQSVLSYPTNPSPFIAVLDLIGFVWYYRSFH